MRATLVERDAVIWMHDEVPSRMIFAGRRWRVTDTPTRLRSSIWEIRDSGGAMYGWRFQATDDSGEVLVFDVYQDAEHWHVHGMYV